MLKPLFHRRLTGTVVDLLEVINMCAKRNSDCALYTILGFASRKKSKGEQIENKFVMDQDSKNMLALSIGLATLGGTILISLIAALYLTGMNL